MYYPNFLKRRQQEVLNGGETLNPRVGLQDEGLVDSRKRIEQRAFSSLSAMHLAVLR